MGKLFAMSHQYFTYVPGKCFALWTELLPRPSMIICVQLVELQQVKVIEDRRWSRRGGVTRIYTPQCCGMAQHIDVLHGNKRYCCRGCGAHEGRIVTNRWLRSFEVDVKVVVCHCHLERA